VALKRGPLILVSTTEELLGRNTSSSGFSLENREYGRGDPLRWPRDNLYPQKLALTSPKSGGRSVDIVRLRAKAIEFFFFFCFLYEPHCKTLGEITKIYQIFIPIFIYTLKIILSLFYQMMEHLKFNIEPEQDPSDFWQHVHIRSAA
jgi:hypothetical protein